MNDVTYCPHCGSKRIREYSLFRYYCPKCDRTFKVEVEESAHCFVCGKTILDRGNAVQVMKEVRHKKCKPARKVLTVAS